MSVGLSRAFGALVLVIAMLVCACRDQVPPPVAPSPTFPERAAGTGMRPIVVAFAAAGQSAMTIPGGMPVRVKLLQHWPWGTSSPGELSFTITETKSIDGRVI